MAELGRMEGNTGLRKDFNSKWQHQWMPKIKDAIKIIATKTNMQRMKEINVSTDLEDEDGRIFVMHFKVNVVL